MGIMTLPVLGFDPMSLGHDIPNGVALGGTFPGDKRNVVKGYNAITVIIFDDVMMVDDVAKDILDGEMHCISGSFPVVGERT